MIIVNRLLMLFVGTHAGLMRPVAYIVMVYCFTYYTANSSVKVLIIEGSICKFGRGLLSYKGIN